MAVRPKGNFLKDLGALFQIGLASHRTDEELLETFARRDGEVSELAFAVLVERHGPMVLRTCRRVLGRSSDVEDAFQATFLVLVRRAGSVRNRHSVGGWLHGVACRVASRILAEEATRRRHESGRLAPTPGSPPIDEETELGRALHEELDRLPERFRTPLVLCDLEGKKHEQAARDIGCPVGTVHSRLVRGRERLRERLRRRGLGPAAGAVMVALRAELTRAAPADALKGKVIFAAARAVGRAVPAGSVPARVAALSSSVMRNMTMTELKPVAALFLAMVVASGSAWAAAMLGQSGPAPVVQQVGPAAARGPEPAEDPAPLPRASRAARSVADPRRKVMALIQVSKAQAASGERAEALGTLKEARALAASLPTDSAASAISRWTLLARVAETQADGGDIEAARGTFEDIRKPIGAVEDLGRDDNQHALDHVRVGIARAQARAGRFAEADLELRQIGDGLRKADGLALIAEAKSASGDWEGAGKAVDAIEFAETKVKALGELAKKRAKAGDPGAARRLLDNALQAAERAERDDGRAAARRWVALARAEVDGVAAGLAAAGAIPALPEDNFPFRQRALSELRARAGDYAGARASAREIPERYQGGRQRALVLRLVSQIEADAGDIAGALATVAEIKLPVARAGALIDVAAARAQAGDRAGGAESFREALRLLQATADAPEPLFDDRPPTYRELARAQAAAGDAAAAEAWIDALDSPELRAWCLTGLVEGAAKAKLPGGAGPREGRGAVDPIPNSRQWAVRVGPNVQVSRARPDLPHEEVFIVADTGDPRRLAAASMTRPAHEVAAKTILYASTDGGASWETTLECRGPDPQGSFDPAFAAGPDGTLVYVQVVSPKSDDAEHREDRLEFRASRDGGATWGTATVVRRFFDRPFLTFDRSAGKHRGRLYCTNVNGILVSDDRGATFAKLRPWDRARRMLGYGRGNPAVLSDGRLLVSYAPYTLAHTKYVAVQASTDGGDSFTEERRVAGEFAYHVPNSLPAMAVVPGPGDKDRVLLAWTEPQADGRPCIRLATSEDRGASFSRTEVLSEQPDPGVDRAAQRKRGYESIMPTLAVDRRGVVGLSWYDTRDLPEEGQGWDVRFRASPDGGRTWLPSVRVTEVSTLLAGDDRGRRARVHRGDTAGLDAGSDGRFHCLWVDGRTGLGQAWTASLEVTSGK